MKITKRQLTQIIREERARVLQEQAVAGRPVWAIAEEIEAAWPGVHPTARPYLDAMHSLESVDDSYGMDSGRLIVAYFLSNATRWRGPEAQRIKAELKSLMGSGR